jgi:hypothetical protein
MGRFPFFMRMSWSFGKDQEGYLKNINTIWLKAAFYSSDFIQRHAYGFFLLEKYFLFSLMGKKIAGQTFEQETQTRGTV